LDVYLRAGGGDEIVKVPQIGEFGFRKK